MPNFNQSVREEKKLKILLREKTSGMSRADERRKICALSKERVKNSCRRRNFTTCGFDITFFTLSFYITTMMTEEVIFTLFMSFFCRDIFLASEFSVSLVSKATEGKHDKMLSYFSN